MKCFAVSFLLLCLPVSAATVTINLASGIDNDQASGSDTTLYTADLSDRSGLTAGQPILVILTPAAISLGLSTLLQAPATFRDTFTITALLGTQTGSVSTTLVLPVTPTPPTTTLITSVDISPFSLTVPWATDLSAMSITFLQQFSVDGAGNAVNQVVGTDVLRITTQTVPESSGGILAASAGLLLSGRRSRSAGVTTRLP